MVRCFLVLEDGTVLEGVSFGHESTVLAEIVFTTSMSGYQESITDPAYKGQILVSAFPLIGNYGVTDEYDLSGSIQAEGLVVREYCKEPSDMYGGRTLDEYLKKNKVSGISGVDTRDIVSLIRDKGAMNAAIVYNEKDIADVVKKLKVTDIRKKNLVSAVSAKKIKKIDNGKKVTVGVIDCGADRSMLKDLSEIYNVIVFPYDTDAEEIVKAKVNGLIVSGGPGDPEHPDIAKLVNTVKKLSQSLPIAGVAFGAMVIAKAFGCKSLKLKFGHHGPTQPVKHGDSVYISSQNHMYTVDQGSMKGTGLVMDQTNVNDGTLEGFSHATMPVFGIQYRPVPLRFDEHSYFYNKLDKIMGAKR